MQNDNPEDLNLIDLGDTVLYDIISQMTSLHDVQQVYILFNHSSSVSVSHDMF